MNRGAWFGVLGPLEFRRDGETVAVSRLRVRSLLAVFLLYAGEPLSRDRLIDELWGERPPSSAVSALHVHLSQLRQVVEGLLVRVPAGYVIQREEIELDVWRFDALLDQARAQPNLASTALREALSLFRGEPLSDVECECGLGNWRRLLEERRLQATLSCFDAELAEGRGAELVGDLERLASEHALEERLTGQLMLALYRAGRQADALAAYERVRSQLDTELGLQPGAELRDLQVAILNQDSVLAARATEPAALATKTPSEQAEPAATATEPALRARETSLPQLVTPTFGREEALEDLLGLLGRQEVRAVTLIGPGGVGKTRLALLAAHAVAGEFADGACWAELAGVPRGGDVAAAVARALQLTPDGLETSEEALLRELRDRHLLLVLDNFEHVIDSAVLVAELHRTCPQLELLITSREALDLAAEHRFAVAPLAVPAVDAPITAASVEATAATAMLLAGARRRDHRLVLGPDDPAAVARICTRLEGLPLALELAAARTTTLAVGELADELDAELDALGAASRDLPQRQRTLQATIEWSYGLLEPPLQRAFAHFAVFAGGASLDAAVAVTSAPRADLEALVAKSLIVRRQTASGLTRLVMLETVRHHARRLLADSAAEDAVRRRHLQFHLLLAEAASARLSTREERSALAQLDEEIENLHAARTWGLVHEPALALRLAGELALYWSIRREPMALEWLDQAIRTAGEDAPVADRALATLGRARALAARQETALSMAGTEAALALYRQAGDDAGIATALSALAFETGNLTGDLAQQRRLAEEAIEHAERCADERVVARALCELAESTTADERPGAVARAAASLERIGHDRGLVSLYSNAGYVALAEEQIEEALGHLHEAAVVVERIGNPWWRARILGNFGLCELFSGEHDRARESFSTQLGLCVEHGYRHDVGESLAGLGAIAALDRQGDAAARLRGAATASGYPPGEMDRTIMERLDRECYDAAHTRVGERAWEEAYAIGLAWTYEEATTFALAWAAERPPATGRRRGDRRVTS